jgi:hypothetical protein
MNENTKKIIELYDGKMSSKEIAGIVGLTDRYVRKVATKKDLSRLHCGAQPGQSNHQFVSGRRVDLDGYVLVTAPPDHPYARHRSHRQVLLIFEHRLAVELQIGRPLLPGEVVDHKDGLTLHNDPSNLRFFDQNKDHLHETLKGRPKQISLSGQKNIRERNLPVEDRIPVDTYYLRRARGDVRLQQILLAALKLGIDSPFLLGTHRHLEKVGIDPSSRSMLEQELESLYRRYAEDLLR